MLFRVKVLPLSLALALGGATTALAGPVEMFAQGAGTLDHVPFTTVRDPVSGFGNTNVDVLFDVLAPGTSGSNMFFHSYGYSSGGFNFFGSRASGGGVYDGTGTFHLQQEVTNTGVAQPYNFNFVVDAGEVSGNCINCNGGGSAMVSLKVAIDRDVNDGGAVGLETLATGEVLFVINPDGTWEFTRSGLATQFQNIAGNTSQPIPQSTIFQTFSWDSTLFGVNLGTIGAGNTFRLEYDLLATAKGEFINPNPTECSRFDDFQQVFPDDKNPANVPGNIEEARAAVVGGATFCTSWLPGTQARSGDPGNIPGGNDNTFSITASTPEPASTALLGIGLGAIFLAGRRRAKQTA